MPEPLDTKTLTLKIDEHTYEGLAILRDVAAASETNRVSKRLLTAALIAANHVCEMAQKDLAQREGPQRRRRLRALGGGWLQTRSPSPGRMVSGDENEEAIAKAAFAFGTTNTIPKAAYEALTHYLVAAVTEGAIDDEDAGEPIIPTKKKT